MLSLNKVKWWSLNESIITNLLNFDWINLTQLHTYIKGNVHEINFGMSYDRIWSKIDGINLIQLHTCTIFKGIMHFGMYCDSKSCKFGWQGISVDRFLQKLKVNWIIKWRIEKSTMICLRWKVFVKVRMRQQIPTKKKWRFYVEWKHFENQRFRWWVTT